jgi:hypothetical protein
MRFMAMLAGVLGAAVIATGCGSSGSDETQSTVSEAAFTNKADGICKGLLADAESKMLAWSKSKEKNAEGEQVNAQGETASEIMRAYYETKVDQLQNLSPPEAAQTQFATMLAALEKAIEEGDKSPEVFISGSVSMEEAGEIAGKLGLECSA